jgi:alkyl hydroperoxide reductase subunit AhpC
MASDLAKYDVSIIALSKDSVADAARHKSRDGLDLTLLSDPKLDVIKQYGVEHHKAVEFSTGRFSILGIPLALLPSFKTMAIPTTLLIDENGVIQWVDQADDFRLRSSEARVLEAVVRAFG